MKQLYVRDILDRDVISLSARVTLEQAVRLLSRKKKSCLIVVESKKPIGIVTERDIVRSFSDYLQGRPANDFELSDFMTSPPVCVKESANLYEALVISRSNKIRHLPVVDDDDNLVGILTQNDIARAHFMAVEKQRDIIERQVDERTRDLQEANEELKALSLQDSLLGIGNRRAMEVDAGFTHGNAVRYQRPYSLALLDVDYFKGYNDHYGHTTGDSALVKVAECAKRCIRATDRLYRYGGEEFLLLMPETYQDEALIVVERVLSHIEGEQIEHNESPFGVITVSSGVCDLATILDEKPDASWLDAVELADKSLYQAKAQGRNRLVGPRDLIKLAVS